MEIVLFVATLSCGAMILGALAHHDIYPQDLFCYLSQLRALIMHRLFQLHDTPIVLGALLAFLAWGSNHLVEMITATPYIEYEVSNMDGGKYDEWREEFSTAVMDCDSRKPITGKVNHIVKITIANLSDNILLTDVSIAFGFRPNEGVEILGSQLLSKAPAIKPDDAEKCGKRYVEINKLTFHPKAEYTLVLITSDAKEPYAVLDNSNNAIIFKKASKATWFVRYELEIVLFLLAAAILVAMVYLYSIASVVESNNGDSKND
jgi:hypothetical protein